MSPPISTKSLDSYVAGRRRRAADSTTVSARRRRDLDVRQLADEVSAIGGPTIDQLHMALRVRCF